MVMVGPARKAGRGSCLIPDHLDLAAIDRLANFVPAKSDGAIARPEIRKPPALGRARPLDFAASLPPSPRHIARASPDAALRPPLPRLRPRAHQLLAVPDPLESSRLHRRHPASLAL